ncbi:hypothetical protein L3V77_06060 [Vibrio sp. DW001]|uniref:hypothetical protein n=1 Tax=Vibrio sp. DW001 TaxID=2912315 RepID=UPI0023B0499F|nr:hypothetical protein [Vibrio sp. DW001]WED27801.1 hypothetical protein L3V77_06060 [Vibrio sp. DW001]
MVDFVEKLRLKGKAEEDLYFAKHDRELIDAMHKRADELALEGEFSLSDEEINIVSNTAREK